MNGKLYIHNLVKIAESDGTPNLSIALTENTILKRWAQWITDDPDLNLSGASDYRIWQEIYFVYIGSRISGVTQQSIIARIAENFLGDHNLRGFNQPEIVSIIADAI